jgi:16S rRNA C1402 (ribose-2'-O) methylase RsmI
VRRGTLAALAEDLARFEQLKGELVVIVAPPSLDQTEASDDAIVAALEQALETESFRDAVRSVAEHLSASRARVYELGLALTRARG